MAAVSVALRNANGTTRFSKETRARVLRSAKALNYRPNRLARALVTGVVPVAAVAVRLEQTDMPALNLYLHDVLPSAGMRLHELGLEMLFLPYRDHAEEIARLKALIADRLIGGIVSNVIPCSNAGLIAFLREAGLPFVLMGRLHDKSVVSVAADDAVMHDMLRRYAESKGLHRVLILGAKRCRGKLILKATDPQTRAGRAVTDKELRAPETLLAMAGALPWRMVGERDDISENRKILFEDVRVWTGIRPALVVKASTGRHARLAVEILAQWMTEGSPPCKGRQTVRTEVSDVQVVV